MTNLEKAFNELEEMIDYTFATTRKNEGSICNFWDRGFFSLCRERYGIVPEDFSVFIGLPNSASIEFEGTDDGTVCFVDFTQFDIAGGDKTVTYWVEENGIESEKRIASFEKFEKMSDEEVNNWLEEYNLKVEYEDVDWFIEIGGKKYTIDDIRKLSDVKLMDLIDCFGVKKFNEGVKGEWEEE